MARPWHNSGGFTALLVLAALAALVWWKWPASTAKAESDFQTWFMKNVAPLDPSIFGTSVVYQMPGNTSKAAVVEPPFSIGGVTFPGKVIQVEQG